MRDDVREPWLLSDTAYHVACGVYLPYILEISIYQYGRLSKRARKTYDAKRRGEWDASAKCSVEYRERIRAAYLAGEVGHQTPGLTEDARAVLLGVDREQRLAAEGQAQATLDAANKIAALAALAPGQRVWSVIYRCYGTVERVSTKTARVRLDRDSLCFPHDVRFLRRRSPDDVERAS